MGIADYSHYNYWEAMWLRLFSLPENASSEPTGLQSNLLVSNQASRERGTSVIVQQLLHLTVLLTFGLSYPVLCVVITSVMCGENLLWKLVVGKQLEESLRADGVDQSEVSFRYYSDNVTQQMDGSYGHGWLVVKSCRLWLLGTVVVFWSFLFFDMIGDIDGGMSGVLGVGIYLGCTLLLVYLLKRCKIYGSIIKSLGQKIDSYLGCFSRWRIHRAKGVLSVDL